MSLPQCVFPVFVVQVKFRTPSDALRVSRVEMRLLPNVPKQRKQRSCGKASYAPVSTSGPPPATLVQDDQEEEEEPYHANAYQQQHGHQEDLGGYLDNDQQPGDCRAGYGNRETEYREPDYDHGCNERGACHYYGGGGAEAQGHPDPRAYTMGQVAGRRSEEWYCHEDAQTMVDAQTDIQG